MIEQVSFPTYGLAGLLFQTKQHDEVGRLTRLGHRLALAMAADVAGPPTLAFDAINNCGTKSSLEISLS